MTEPVVSTPQPIDDRPVKTAIARGLRRKCPQCGKGHMFAGYLKVADECPVCAENLSHHRADDGPAYLTLLIVGHLLAPLLHVTWTHFRPEPMTMATVFSIGCIALSLFLLPRMKGFVVSIQWSRRMHGFGQPV